jgi:hypothetical protein
MLDETGLRRPRQPADQRYESACLFGAICPARGTVAALALPFADTEAMQLHLEEISRNIALGAHAVLIFDRAGRHTTPNLVMPKNITPIWLPSRAPELNPAENIWQYLRANWLSNRVFENLRPNHRRGLRSLEQTHRPNQPHPINRPVRLGSRRSRLRAFGITFVLDQSAGADHNWRSGHITDTERISVRPEVLVSLFPGCQTNTRQFSCQSAPPRSGRRFFQTYPQNKSFRPSRLSSIECPYSFHCT